MNRRQQRSTPGFALVAEPSHRPRAPDRSLPAPHGSHPRVFTSAQVHASVKSSPAPRTPVLHAFSPPSPSLPLPKTNTEDPLTKESKSTMCEWEHLELRFLTERARSMPQEVDSLILALEEASDSNPYFHASAFVSQWFPPQ